MTCHNGSMRRRGNRLLRVISAVCVSVAALGTPAPPAGATGDPSYGKQWGLALVGAQTAWSVGTGSGITIAVVDTGVDVGHEDLRAKVLAGKNFVNESGSAQDDHGHGTHVAGTAAASTGNGVGVAGVAPGASILPVKVLRPDASGDASGSPDDISAGIKWAADRGAHVINLSLGPNAVIGALFGNGLAGDVNYAWDRGSIVVIAAGNDFLFPASAGDVPAIVVTATTRHDSLAGYASTVGKSARWGMSAPGGAGGFNEADDILSTYWKPRSANSYEFLAGTSMATPHVAGAAAVLRGLGLTPQQTVDRLLATAKDLGSPGRDDTFGSGRLDLACAVGRCGDTTPTAAAPGGDKSSGSGSGTAGSDGQETTPKGPDAGNAGSDGSGRAGEAPAASGAGNSGSGTGRSGTRSGAAGNKATGGRRSGRAPTFGAVSPNAPAPSPPAAVTEGATGEEIPGGSGGDTTSGESVAPVPRLRLSAAATDERSDMVLCAAAAGLLLLVGSWAFRLRRRRPGIS